MLVDIPEQLEEEAPAVAAQVAEEAAVALRMR